MFEAIGVARRVWGSESDFVLGLVLAALLREAMLRDHLEIVGGFVSRVWRRRERTLLTEKMLRWAKVRRCEVGIDEARAELQTSK